jgi:phosphorylcholine metabolism protein LicD
MKYDSEESQINSIWKKIIFQYSKLYYKNHAFEDLFQHFDQKRLAAYRDKPTKTFGNLLMQWHENWIWPKSFFDDYCYLPFEVLSLRAPLHYHEVLAWEYGDYMKYPDLTKEIQNTHGTTIMDPETPYMEFDFETALKELSHNC